MTRDSTTLGLSRITLGGEISDQLVLSSLRKAFPSSKISHIYASTEAGVGFSVQDGFMGFPLDYIGQSKLHDVELKIVGNILWIKSEGSANRILNGALLIDEFGFINTGDVVEIQGDRVLFVGRDSGTINVGGNKVIPEEVEAVLICHEDVCGVKVFGKKNSVLGMLVSAEVVVRRPLRSGSEKDLKKSLISFCKGELEAFKVPTSLKIVDEIVLNEAGKIVRKV